MPNGRLTAGVASGTWCASPWLAWMNCRRLASAFHPAQSSVVRRQT